MNKRGDTERLMFIIGYIAFILVMLAVLLIYIGNKADNGDFIKKTTSLDISMTIDALYATPGEVDLIYQIDQPIKALMIGKAEKDYFVVVSDFVEDMKMLTPNAKLTPYAEDKVFSELNIVLKDILTVYMKKGFGTGITIWEENSPVKNE